MPHPVPREKIPWHPAIDAGRCDGCGLCLDFCPHSVYARGDDSGPVLVAQPFQCVVGCDHCVPICPRRAISFPDLESVMGLIRRLREKGDPK